MAFSGPAGKRLLPHLWSLSWSDNPSAILTDTGIVRNSIQHVIAKENVPLTALLNTHADTPSGRGSVRPAASWIHPHDIRRTLNRLFKRGRVRDKI